MSEITQNLLVPIRLTRGRTPLSILVITMTIGSLLVMLIFGLLIYQIFFLDRVHLGIQIGGVPAGTLTRPQIKQIVIHQAEGLLRRQITLVSQEGTWTFTAAELGARVDIEQTVNQAFEVGRQGGFFSDLQIQYQTMQQPANIEPVIRFDSGPANIALTNLAEALNRPPQQAQLILNDDLSLTVIPSEIGQSLDLETTREAIRKAIVLRGQASIDLVFHYIDPTVTEVEPARQQVEQLLNQPFTFSFRDKIWSLGPEYLAPLISFTEEIDKSGTGRVVAVMNSAPLYTYFDNLAFEINQPPINAWFDLDVSTWTLHPIIASQNQHTLDIESAVEMTVAQLYGPAQHQLTLPVTIHPPAVSMENVEQLDIRELISSNTTYFKGSSAERMQNIAVSASKFHGLVIPPDGIFSFNEHLGDVNAANGFVESLIIKGDRTAVGIGGGVCQVSTTAFRVAFFGGFEIVERWAHGYRVSWYETGSAPGLDATIYSPTVDFKFRNDTDNFLLIQTETDLIAGTVTFSFYGTSSNRTVIVSDPVEANLVRHGDPIYEVDATLKPGQVKQVDWAKDGVDVTVYRTVLEGDTVIHQDTIFSRYSPWRAIYKIGPEAD
jgi:vancomycin resistance protein YoaR